MLVCKNGMKYNFASKKNLEFVPIVFDKKNLCEK